MFATELFQLNKINFSSELQMRSSNFSHAKAKTFFQFIYQKFFFLSLFLIHFNLRKYNEETIPAGAHKRVDAKENICLSKLFLK